MKIYTLAELIPSPLIRTRFRRMNGNRKVIRFRYLSNINLYGIGKLTVITDNTILCEKSSIFISSIKFPSKIK